jgi:hypothetical protein
MLIWDQFFMATCLWVGIKVEEPKSPRLMDLIQLCENRFSRESFIKCEKQIFSENEYNVLFPLVLDFGKNLSALFELNSLFDYCFDAFLNISLFMCNFSFYKPSTIACSCFILSLIFSKIQIVFRKSDLNINCQSLNQCCQDILKTSHLLFLDLYGAFSSKFPFFIDIFANTEIDSKLNFESSLE